MYEAIGCEVDFSCPLYKQYRLNKVAEKYPGRRTHTHTHGLNQLPVPVLHYTDYYFCIFLPVFRAGAGSQGAVCC